jgi:hypothetical protein|tara:strand:- start:1948 stop:2328 length:381 start_codon:yes stop_codon:yes gene_type:complete
MKIELNIYTLIGLAGIAYILFIQDTRITSGDLDQVVYVYEKDDGPVPRPVAGALMEINLNESLKIEATEFESDTVDPDGDVPEQYQAALAAAKEAGLPALVVLAGDRVVKVIKDPSTMEQVMESIN